jgi:type II secretory pathway component PulF
LPDRGLRQAERRPDPRGLTEPLPDGRTRLTQTFKTIGVIPAISSRLFALGSYEGSFKGELQKFARIAEREAATP